MQLRANGPPGSRKAGMSLVTSWNSRVIQLSASSRETLAGMVRESFGLSMRVETSARSGRNPAVVQFGLRAKPVKREILSYG